MRLKLLHQQVRWLPRQLIELVSTDFHRAEGTSKARFCRCGSLKQVELRELRARGVCQSAGAQRSLRSRCDLSQVHFLSQPAVRENMHHSTFIIVCAHLSLLEKRKSPKGEKSNQIKSFLYIVSNHSQSCLKTLHIRSRSRPNSEI